jgi:WD40 repeat protein
VWDVATGKEVRQIDVQSGTEALSLAFTPDGKGLACAGAWNDSSFLPKGGINIQGVQWMPHEGHRVLLWDAGTGQEVRQFTGLTAKLKSVALSPDGRLIAASAGDGRLALWDLASGQERLFILAHPGHKEAGFAASPAIAFSPGGKTLASAGQDGTVRLWDARTGKELPQYRAPQGGLTSIAFTPDGKSLVTGGTDTTATVWDLTAPPVAGQDREPKVIFIGD